MKVESDHYRVLDLPSGKEGTKLTEKQIRKAYRRKALQLHPDKRPNEPEAITKFQRLQSSYATLMDPHARKVFDDSLIRIDNKPSSFKPKKQTSSSDEPKNEEESDMLSRLGVVCCYMLCLYGPMAVPVWVTAAVVSGLGTGCWVYFCYIEPNHHRPTAAGYAATKQQSKSRREDHEDIDDDWVMV